MKIVFQTDGLGWFVGTAVADESPLEPGVFLLPRGAVEVGPPEARDGLWPRWTGARWELALIPPGEPEPEPPPLPSRLVSPRAFMRRFTEDERIALRAAARQNARLEDWLDLLRLQAVDLDDPDLRAGMERLVVAGLLTAARRDEILSDQAVAQVVRR